MTLSVKGLSAGYGSATIVRDVSLSVEPGSSLAVLGRNGMGKTTLVRAILGYLRNRLGSVQVLGQDVVGWPTHRVIRMGVGYGPQDAAIFPDLTVDENLRLSSLRVKDYEAARDRVLEHFPILGQRLRQRAGTLSGGEQKMLVLSRALIPEPQLVILDEISEGLQPSILNRARDVLLAERERRPLAMLLVEQNMDFALSVADRIAVLQVGEVLFELDASDPSVRDRVTKAFSL